jgi:5-methylcytosine-specific restriction endonuclease McrA
MVANVSPPRYDFLETLNSIFAERGQFLPFYRAITDDLTSQFLFYKESNGNPEVISPLSIRDYTQSDEEAVKRKKSLINLYYPKADKIPFDIFAEMRRKHGLLFCPSCGEDGAPGTLDHYLPKEHFPELAICLINLTPMCNRCQGEKSSDYLTESGVRMFLHPYFDVIDECMFEIQILPPFSAPSNFIVSIKGGLEQSLKDVVEQHIQGVAFIERLVEFCESKHLHLLKIMSDDRLDEDPFTAPRLIRKFLRLEKLKADNAWAAIYYQSVLDSPALLDYLDSGVLPEHL